MLLLLLIAAGLALYTAGDSASSSSPPTGGGSTTPPPTEPGKTPEPPVVKVMCEEMDKLPPQIRQALENTISSGNVAAMKTAEATARQYGLEKLADCIAAYAAKASGSGPTKPANYPTPTPPGMPEPIPGDWDDDGDDGDEDEDDPESLTDYCPEAAYLDPTILMTINGLLNVEGSGPQLQQIANQLQLMGYDTIATCVAGLAANKGAMV